MNTSTRSEIRGLTAMGAVIILAFLTAPLWAPMPGALVTMAGQALALDWLDDYGLSMVRDSRSTAAAAVASIDSDGLRILCGIVAVVVGGDALRERAVDMISARSGR